jgi:hypothetical protein
MINPFMNYTQSFNESMTKDDREDAERRMATVRPVTAGIASPAVINAQQSGDAIQETQDAIAAAFKALSVSRSKGKVDVQSFNFSRRALLDAKDTLAIAKSRGTPGEQVLLSQLQEQVETIEMEVGIQLKYLQTSTAKPSMTKDDREDAERRMATVKPVTAGIASPAVINAQQSGDAIQETQDAIAAAFKALSVSRSQGTVNVQSFNFARRELLNAKDTLAIAQSRATPGEQVLMSQLQEQVDTIQGEVDIQLRYLKGAAQTPSSGGSTTVVIPGTGTTGSSVITTTSTGGAPPAAVAGTDWVKLALQVGTAYLLLA